MSTIGVVGAGAMGSGIAQIAAQAGHAVVLVDESESALAKSAASLSKIAERLVGKGKWSAADSERIQSAIVRTSKLEQLARCEWVVEAIVEDLGVKQSLFQTIETIVATNAVLATNTSSLSVTAIAGQLKHPDRFMGLHFFNPAPLMALVEVIPALQTDSSHVDRVKTMMNDWGKSPVIAKDTPGFIVNRLARPFYGEALRIFEEGLATKRTIDAAMRNAGFRMGPFELMDLIGNDVNYAVSCTVFEAFYNDPRYRPSLIQKQHVDAGWLGRKSGKGFYEYEEGKPTAAPSNAPANSDQFDWIIKRIVAMLMNEAADAYYLNIASAQDLEIAMTKGVNYPKGLLAWCNEWGAKVTLNVLESMQIRYGDDRYRPSPVLRDLAAQKSEFTL
ncbi:MAG: 3-hydroxybutyryl-CoA dehydrogenase [Crocinitomicaceae bacterium]|nr:3-hydroxybutyryl-CoA dehydrogenase [Crocinitomicaceae bacterium]